MIPKSLHTVTALVNVARALGDAYVECPIDCLSLAVEALGYANEVDAYGLTEKALAILSKRLR